jgi:hypothetical protein
MNEKRLVNQTKEDKMKLNEVVEVRGVTKKGKDRVKRHGSKWKVIRTSGNGFLLSSVETQYNKWVYTNVKNDFEVVRNLENVG